MVTVSVDESTLRLEVEGADKFWSLKSQLEIPLEHISGAVVDPPEVHDWWKGLRLGGTQGFGILAGTFLYHGERIFWDIHDPSMAIGITTHDERYKELIVEVENPYDVVEMIQQAIQTRY